MAKKIVILGATGSIGTNTLSVLECFKDSYEVTGISVDQNINDALLIAKKYGIRKIAVTNDEKAKELKENGLFNGKVFSGKDCLCEICNGADLVVIAVVGIAGLKPLRYCLENDIQVALATKEAMVYGGKLIRELADRKNAFILPLDSEISAIFQCFEGNRKKDLSKIYLTASGGPFRTWPVEKIKTATLKEALNHPNWSMGKKITIDSATMANKGLELMETRWYFDVDEKDIEIVIQPESIIHSAVCYRDGSVMAQLGATDMKLPIAYALSYPKRRENNSRKLDLYSFSGIHFEKPDYAKFPCLRYARYAIKNGTSAQIVFNAANDAAVSLFLNRRIGFWKISEVIDYCLQHFVFHDIDTFEEIYDFADEVDSYVKRMLRSYL